ncbi:MAG TPA: hypothetical protein VGM04_06490 [Sphingomicrobium sp.]
MATFHIHVINSEFESRNEMAATSMEEARRQALRSALQIGIDEVCNGSHFFGAEVRVEVDGHLKERFMVGMGQSPLK